MLRKVAAILLMFTMSAATLLPSFAQEASPTPLPASACTVDPIDPEAYYQAVLDSVPPLQQPIDPVGQPADEETIASVTAVIEQSVACTNAGDLSRLFAVLDPAYAPTLLGAPYGQFETAFHTAVAPSDSPATPLVDDIDQGSLVSVILSITNIQDHGDGIVSAVTTLQRADYPPTTFTIYLRTDDVGSYIIFYYTLHDVTTPQIPTPDEQ